MAPRAPDRLETDYLVVGAGAVGMAFDAATPAEQALVFTPG